MRADWYADLVYAVQLARDCYAGSLDAIRADTEFAGLQAWMSANVRSGRPGDDAIRVWQGHALPPSFPGDGGEVRAYGIATALAPRSVQPLCCLCSARRILTREPAGVHRGRGRSRPLMLEWREGARAAASVGAGHCRDASALMADLDRAIQEIAVEQATGRVAELLPRSHLRAVAGADARAMRAAFERGGACTATALAKHIEGAAKVPQK